MAIKGYTHLPAKCGLSNAMLKRWCKLIIYLGMLCSACLHKRFQADFYAFLRSTDDQNARVNPPENTLKIN